MTYVWAVLGVILIGLLASIGWAFFVVRPRLARQVQASVAVVARELHGQQPLSIVPAKCEGITDERRADLVGVGTLALTEEGVVFGAGNPDRSLIIARNSITSASVARQLEGSGTPVKKRSPMLAIQWQGSDEQQTTVVFTVGDPLPFVAQLNP
mgnify:FL=1